jgi:hypothetical protein
LTNPPRSHSSLSFEPPRRVLSKLKRPRGSLDKPSVSQADTQWFYSLPDKIRRQHFSAEERELLSSRPDNLTAPSPTCTNRRTPSPYTTPPPPYSFDDPDKPDMDQHYNRARTAGNDGLQRQLTVVPHRPSIHDRTPSRKLSATSPQSPKMPKSPKFTSHQRDWSQAGTMASLTRPSIDSNSPVIDPDAVYYRNPEARHKLRQYLASPQKFDEALNFGFPSSPQTDDELSPSPTPILPPSSSNNDAKAFLRHDSISFIDHRCDDECMSLSYETSDGDTDWPSTPADPDWSWRNSKYNRVSIFGSLNADSLPALDLKFTPDPALQPQRTMTSSPPLPLHPLRLNPHTLPNREMTLRMTLTRPDLRANDEELYGWRKQLPDDDPLALEELPPAVEDHSGQQGVFAVPDSPASGSSMFSRILRKIRR